MGQLVGPRRLNREASGIGGTTPAGRYVSGVSPYGMLDAVGNVFQRTSSTLTDGRSVPKGCAWDDEPGLCRPAFRHGRPAASRHILIGFRCAGPAVPVNKSGWLSRLAVLQQVTALLGTCATVTNKRNVAPSNTQE